MKRWRGWYRIVPAALVIGLATGCAERPAATSAWGDPDVLYVKIDDLTPPGTEFMFPGADIEAVELIARDGNVRVFATSNVDPAADPDDYRHHEVDAAELFGDRPEDVLGRFPQDATGPTSLVDLDRVFYRPEKNYSWRPAYSLDGGTLVVGIDLSGLSEAAREGDLRIKVYNVDGLYYDAGTPDPYRVSVSVQPDGGDDGWRSLGIGAGSSEFPLTGPLPERLTAQQRSEIARILERRPDATPLAPPLDQMVAPTLDRIAGIDTPEQARAELSAFLRTYRLNERRVLEAGDEDHGSWMASWEVLRALNERLEELER